MVSHAMNMIWLCKEHHTDFDQYKFSLIINPFQHKINFMSLCPDYASQVTEANNRIGVLDLNHLSKRAISMRMEHVMKSGKDFQGKSGIDYVGWEGLRDFSINGSEHSKDSESEEVSGGTSEEDGTTKRSRAEEKEEIKGNVAKK